MSSPQPTTVLPPATTGGTANPNASTGPFGPNSNSFYGTPIPIGAGRRAIIGVPVWSKVRGSRADIMIQFGKSGIPAAELTSVQILQLYANNVMIMDRLGETGLTVGGDVFFTVYDGNEAQLPDPLIVADKGVGNAPAFRDRITVMFRDFPIGKYGNGQIPIFRAIIQDEVTDLSYVREFTPLAAASGVRDDWGAVDWSRMRLYTSNQSATAPVLEVWDLTTNAMIATNPILLADGSPVQDIGFSSLFPGLIIDPLYGYAFLFYDQGGADFWVLMFDPMTGREIDRQESGGLDPFQGTRRAACATYKQVHNGKLMGPGGLLVFGGVLGSFGVLRYGSTGFLNLTTELADGAGGTATRTVPALIISDWEPDGSDITGIWAGEDLSGIELPPSPGSRGFGAFYVATEQGLYRYAHNLGFSFKEQRFWVPPGGGEIIDLLGSDNGEMVVIWQEAGAPFAHFLTRVYSPSRGKIVKVGLSDIGEVLVLASVSGTEVYAGKPTAESWTIHNMWARADLSAETFGRFHGTTDFYVYHLRSGAFTHYEVDDWRYAGTEAPTFSNLDLDPGIWWGGLGVQVAWGGNGVEDFGWAKVYLNRAEGGVVELADVIRWFALAAGFEASQITITGIDDVVTGSLITQRVNLWDLVRDMGVIFRFDYFESEGKIKFVRKVRGVGFTLDLTIPADDLVWSQSQDGQPGRDPTSINHAWGGSQEPPGVLELSYVDETANYAVNLISARRTRFPVQTVQNDNVANYVVPIIMTPAVAYSNLVRALYDIALSGDSKSLRLMPKYLRVEPADILSVTGRGGFVHLLKVVEATINADNTISVGAQTFSSDEDVAVPADDTPNVPQTVVAPSVSEAYVIDAPIPNFSIFDATQPVVTTMAVSSGLPGWTGATLWREAAGVATAQYRNEIPPDLIAIATESLGDSGSPEVTDPDSVRVVPIVGTTASIATVTFDEAKEGANLAYYGAMERWEVVAVQTVAVGTDGSMTLSDVIRGLRGTEWAMGLHQPGDRFIFAGAAERPVIVGAAGSEERYAAVGDGLDVETAAVTIWTVNYNSVRPFAPAYATATLAGADINFAWAWSSRVPTELGEDAIFDEPLERYDLEILAANGVTVLRTVAGLTTRAYTYTAANITTDFGGAITEVWVNIYQVSAAFGRGFAFHDQLPVV